MTAAQIPASGVPPVLRRSLWPGKKVFGASRPKFWPLNPEGIRKKCKINRKKAAINNSSTWRKDSEGVQDKLNLIVKHI
jgi:hypothetical protein